jgi:hypothetical protein
MISRSFVCLSRQNRREEGDRVPGERRFVHQNPASKESALGGWGMREALEPVKGTSCKRAYELDKLNNEAT